MFEPVNSRVSFPQLEGEVLEQWKEKDIFRKSVDNRKGGPAFVLYEGPPTANGNPGLHFAMPRAIKDVIPRFKAMKGYHAPRIGGWDTHGLPVELEIEKKLGFSGKAQIEEYGIEAFNKLCRESAQGYITEFEKMTERIGYWVDMDNAYVTFKNSYIESCWWALKQMWDKGLIYQGYRVTPHCPRCETSLSSHEVAQGYKDDTVDPSVFIKFRISLASLEGNEAKKQLADLFGSSEKPAYLLAWTTTPWTLPGNTALAVSPEAEYAVVETEKEYLVMASSLLGVTITEDSSIVTKVKGEDLVGTGYIPLFNPHEYDVDRRKFAKGSSELTMQEHDTELNYYVIAADFVTMDDGTGIVHVAPAYGEADYAAGVESGLNFVHTVTTDGKITGNYPFSGKFVKDADAVVLEELKKQGLLYRAETIKHTYPFCWRCDSPLLYYAKQTWYIRTTEVKDRLISGNKEIKWYPEHIQYGRFGDWLENNVDWAISRERYWGTPLPVWRCENDGCDALECVGGVEDLKCRQGVSDFEEPLDMHRPFVDNVTFTCPKCGGTMRRVPEVIDCWFDSGAMPIAQSHYPFENSTLLEDGGLPADFICEAIDQTRGWFYSLHAISTLLFGKPCYKNVICHGLILDAKGEKMSKSRGNVVSLDDMLNKYGADALRWYFYTAVPMGNFIRFDEKAISEISRRLFSTLWNVYSFFVTYANIDDYKPGQQDTGEPQAELDRWILSGLNQLVLDVDTALENYDPRTASWQIGTFVDELSNWYVRRSRRRFWKSENDTDKVSAYNTLYECLVTLAKLMAPLAPFLAETLYQNLVVKAGVEAPESVHLADFPVADETMINTQLSEANKLAMKVSSLGRAVRSKAGIKVRQPLAINYIGVATDREKRALENESIMQMVLDELNVKTIEVQTFAEVEALDGKEGYRVLSEGTINSALFTELTPELEAEGMAREIVHRIQNMRRSADFDIADHITTYYEADEYVSGVMEDAVTGDYIKQETLSQKLVQGVPDDVDYRETFKLSGREVLLGVKK
ncbi:MAG: isoleucine--tRNA ligase [Dehalococcoidales bacterium]|nr:isoleucine--tRNA ligase [Dehalococcoidales bacterium]